MTCGRRSNFDCILSPRGRNVNHRDLMGFIYCKIVNLSEIPMMGWMTKDHIHVVGFTLTFRLLLFIQLLVCQSRWVNCRPAVKYRLIHIKVAILIVEHDVIKS